MIKLSHLAAGVTAVTVGYASAAVLILQAVTVLGGDSAMQSAWLLGLGLASGITTLFLAWRYKAPILTAWSTPGIILLTTALQGVTPEQAIGVFIFSSALVVLSGFGGWIERLVRWVPPPIAAALLAGILFPFVLGIIPALKQAPAVILSMLAIYFIAKARAPRLVFILLLLSAIGIPAATGRFDTANLVLDLPQWVWIWPDFRLDLMLGIGVPLYVVSMVSQTMPGLFMLRSHGYAPPAGPLLRTTGAAGLLLAPLGVFSIALAAITAAICQNSDADSDMQSRYKAAMVSGVVYILFGLLGASIVSLFNAIPAEVIKALAGIALLSVLVNSLTQAFSHKPHQEAAVVTFVVTASGVAFMGLSSAFWGLLSGMLLTHVVSRLYSKPVS